MEHPSGADDQKRASVLLAFLRLGFPSTCNALKEEISRVASDGTTNGCSLHGQDARAAARAFSFGVETVGTQLFGLCFGFPDTPNYLLPKPMSKHDPLVTIVRRISERQSLRKALPRSWSMALRALRSNRVLGIRLADFSHFVYKVSTRQMLKCEQV